MFEFQIVFPNFNKNHIVMLLSLGKSIKNRRKELKLTQPYLADLAGVSVNTIFKIERGDANPTIEVLTKIAEVLGMEFKLVVREINQLSNEDS